TDLEKWQAAEQVLRRALDLRTELANKFSSEWVRQHDLAATLHNLADLLGKSGKPAEALPLLNEAIRRQNTALAQNPNEPQALRFLANHYLSRGNRLKDLRRGREADQAY